MEDRQSLNPGRVKITLDDGSIIYGTIERADKPVVIGTPLNKASLFNNLNSERYGCEVPSEAFRLLGNEEKVTVPLNGWSEEPSDGWYTNQISVTGMKSVYNPIATVAVTSAELVDDEQDAFSLIKEIETFDGYIICKATSLPSIDVKIRLSGV